MRPARGGGSIGMILLDELRLIKSPNCPLDAGSEHQTSMATGPFRNSHLSHGAICECYYLPEVPSCCSLQPRQEVAHLKPPMLRSFTPHGSDAQIRHGRRSWLRSTAGKPAWTGFGCALWNAVAKCHLAITSLALGRSDIQLSPSLSDALNAGLRENQSTQTNVDRPSSINLLRDPRNPPTSSDCRVRFQDEMSTFYRFKNILPLPAGILPLPCLAVDAATRLRARRVQRHGAAAAPALHVHVWPGPYEGHPVGPRFNQTGQDYSRY